MNKLDQAREQVFYAEITAQLATARQRAASERERLIRALGLWGGDLAFPAAERAAARCRRGRATLAAVEVDAVRRRVDLQIARIELEALAKSYGLTKATRFVNLLDVAGISKTHARAGRRRASTSAASTSSCRCRSSISARRACGRPSKPTCRPSTG